MSLFTGMMRTCFATTFFAQTLAVLGLTLTFTDEVNDGQEKKNAHWVDWILLVLIVGYIIVALVALAVKWNAVDRVSSYLGHVQSSFKGFKGFQRVTDEDLVLYGMIVDSWRSK